MQKKVETHVPVEGARPTSLMRYISHEIHLRNTM